MSQRTATPRTLLTGAAITAAALFGVYAIAYEWGSGSRVDSVALLGFQVIRVSAVTHAARLFQSLCEPLPYVVLCVVLLVIVLATRGPFLAGACLAFLAAANASTEALKPLIASASGIHGETMVGAGSFPSGHSTAATALALAAVIAAPRTQRAAAVLVGGLFALAVSWSELVLGSHLPSDVLGGYFVAGCWAILTLAGLRWLSAHVGKAHVRQRDGHGGAPPISLTTATAAFVTVGGVAVILALLHLRPEAIRASPLIDFGSVGVVMTLSLAGLLSGVAALAGAASIDGALPGDRFGDR